VHPWRRRWYLILLPLALFSAAALQSQTVVPDTLALKHLGEVVTVEGRVNDVHVSSKRATTFMNFGGAFPDITFSAHVPDSVGARIVGLNGLGGRRVRVTGEVWLQDEKWPAITVSDPAQIVTVE
jgi:hypothetical protein